MAEIKIDPHHQAFALQMVSLYQQQGVALSEEAQALVLLATEAWFRDAPRFKTAKTDDEMHVLAKSIVETSLEERHMKRARGVRSNSQPPKVSFHFLLYALATGGQRFLRGLLEKGF